MALRRAQPSFYEEDHLISLELSGAPRAAGRRGLAPLRRHQSPARDFAADRPLARDWEPPERHVGSSTFRFVLAALLADALDLHPHLLGTKVALSASDNGRLSAWQREQLLLTWCARKRPWEIESEVIGQLTPPLNSSGNAAHAFYPALRATRAESRRQAAAAAASDGSRSVS